MKLKVALTQLAADALALHRQKVEITKIGEIPEPDKIPLLTNEWLRLDDVTCVFADMVRSTELSVTRDAVIVAKLYQLFTGNAVRILNSFGAEYVDVRGDGAFGLFTGSKGFYSAFAAAVTIKTFTSEYAARIVKDSGLQFQLASHIGMQSGRLLVKRIGLRGNMQNEVWAGKPVNIASKLASKGLANDLVVSGSVYDRFASDLIYLSCGCTTTPGGESVSGAKINLWRTIELDPSMFGLGEAYILKSAWCRVHGEDYCNAILDLGDE